MSNTAIPSIYRIFFGTIDPLLATTGILSTLTAPESFLASYFASPRIAPETRFALDALAGFFASTVVLQIALPRLRPTDAPVWKALQAAILVQNAAMLAAFARVKARAGQLSPATWTRAEWAKQIGVVAAATIRIAFLWDVGMKA